MQILAMLLLERFVSWIRVLSQGGNKVDWAELEAEARGVMAAGAKGLAVGRNVWQADEPLVVAEKLSRIVIG